MIDAFVSWSGGKDSTYAAYVASQNGFNLRRLFSMVHEDGQRSRSHRLSARWLELQAGAIGVPLLQRRTAGGDYEAQFRDGLSAMRQEGITHGIFGDIDFNAHRQWIERVCRDAGVTPHLPLWLMSQDSIMSDFVAAGFVATVVVARADVLGREWLGRQVDRDFLSSLKEIPGVTPCGEAGEYHTFVTDGPLFRKRLELVETRASSEEGRWFLDISRCEQREK